MIKANELRIGNWIARLDDSIFQVSAEDIKRINELTEITEKLAPKPIPLTEKWSIKFGFEKSIGSLAYRKGNFGILIWEDGSVTIEFKNIAIAVISFVHEFQNIYFALTGEELTIKTENK